MKSQIELITPTKAREMLEHNTGNRRVRAAWVRNLAGMISSGEWKITHQGVAFDTTGRLVDGQHRLMAIVEADKAAKIMVSRGLSDDTYKYVDGGRPRVYSDRINLVSDARDNVIANKIVWAYLCSAQQRHSDITVSLIEDTYIELAEGLAVVIPYFRKHVRRITVSHVGAAAAVMCQKHPERGVEFLDGLISGELLERTSPIMNLRNFLLGERSSYGTEIYWKTVAATQAFLQERNVVRLSVATHDLAGNTYSRETKARTRKGREANVTKRTNKLLSATA